MGYNATVVVLLDRLDEIKKDPKFGEKLANAILFRASHNNPDGPRYNDIPYVPGQTQVVEAHHADGTAIIAVGGNVGRQIGFVLGWSKDPDTIIKELEKDRRANNREKKRKGIV